MPVYETRRWRGIVAVALVTLGVGLLATNPGLVLLAIVAVGVAASLHVVGPPPEISLALDRTVTPAEPEIDEPVSVTLTVRNTGDRTVRDVRLIDGVPPLATVISGTPRIAGVIRPGETLTLTYTLTVDSGKHRFRPTTVITHNLAGTVERTTDIDTPTVINCDDRSLSIPLASFVTHRPGPISTDHPGVGIEFYGTREVTPGEAVDRIDWRRFARSGELVSVEFRPERSANVMICMDTANSPSGRSTGPRETPELVVRSHTVADRLIAAIGGDRHAVGLSTHGPEHLWHSPQVGRSQVEQLRRTLDSHRAFQPPEPESERIGRRHHNRDNQARGPQHEGPIRIATRSGISESTDDITLDPSMMPPTLEDRIGHQDQVIFVSPLLHDDILQRALALEPAGTNRVSFVTPTPRLDDSIGARMVRLERVNRIRTLRSAGVRVYEWQPDESLTTAAETWLEQET